MSDLRRWRGLVQLVRDGVEHGSRAVERVHLETAARPFGILESIPGVAEPTRIVHTVHDATVSTVHAIVRGVSHAVTTAAEAGLRAAEEHEERGSGAG
jgi:hypothetical protein